MDTNEHESILGDALRRLLSSVAARAPRGDGDTTLQQRANWITDISLPRVGSSIGRVAPKAFEVGSVLKNLEASLQTEVPRRVGSSIGRAAPF